MSIERLYTLADAQEITGENRNLITFLIKERQITSKLVGRAKVLNDAGLNQLRKAIADYRAKPEPAATNA